VTLLEALLLRRATLAIVRILKRVVITLVILAALAAGGDVWLTNTAERKAGEQLQKEFDLSARPVVHIQGFPLLLRILQGKIPGVTIDGRKIEVQGLLIDRFHVEVEGLDASLSDLRGGVRNVRVGGGEASAEITQDAANAYLESQKERARVTFGDGTTRIRTRQPYGGHTYTLEATGDLEIDGQELVFTAKSVTMDGKPPPALLAARARRDASFRVKLPALPGGIRARRVVVQRGVARLEAEFGATSLKFNS
jgi:hypothetical protein